MKINRIDIILKQNFCVLILFPFSIDLIFFLIIISLKTEEKMINQDLKKELLKNVEITKQSAQNNFEILMDGYVEVLSRLDLITYLIISDNKKSS